MVKSNRVRIVEVGPRDGLQNVKTVVPLRTKLELIRRLRETGLETIEITSVVSSRSIPQLSDCGAVLAHPDIQSIIQDTRSRAPVLIPNVKGLEIALKHNVREVAVFVSASEGFSKANINCSVQKGLDRAREVAGASRKHGLVVRGYVSCIFACPYEGPTPFSAVLNCVQQLLDMGCYEVSLGDTLGVGVPSNVESLLDSLQKAGISMEILAGHFHDTYGQALSNIWTAYRYGVRIFDSSVGGLGGCPYAPGAKGNVATEDVVYMFERAGVHTGVDLGSLARVGDWISNQLEKENESRAGKALLANQAVVSSSLQLSSTAKQTPKETKSPRKLTWERHASSEGLQILRSGKNIKVVLDRPRNGNALTSVMISNLTSFLEGIASDPSITRVVITATGKYFCTGMDLGKDTSVVSKGQSASDAQFKSLTRLFEAVDNAPQVTIACVQGPAYGGGVGLTFACDIRIMTRTANMTMSEVKLGLCPAVISKYVTREWGAAFAREAMLSGRAVPPAELARIGVISQLVETEAELSTALDKYLTDLKVSAPHASTMAKELVRLSWINGGGGIEQKRGIEKVFGEMMAGNDESAFGLKQFQSGNKVIDWDQYNPAGVKSKAKL